MATRYPIILAHGVAAKQLRIMNAFGRIGDELKRAGNDVYVADTDGFGKIETNAEQLRDFILAVLEKTGAEKVNIIAHSKGGLDSKYMITELGMEDRVASLTTLCTPHQGSIIASWVWDLPRWMKGTIAFFINVFYKFFLRDKHPDALGACEQLRKVDESAATLEFSSKVYCQSYSSSLKRGRDCFIMALPMKIYKHFEKVENDGLVSCESAKFGNYRGECLDISVSHVQIIDLFSKKSQKEKIYAFYNSVADELAEMGF
ncbi:MAG: alpha/beta fold hydrolase [Clostridia bacterium]|nr:alpha/beta fold hydrolase [Clostridia bacterium]